jgi:glycosyltransferase involved in cell wall biosynthesis
MSTTVTVVIPVHNGASTIAAAIHSALRQTRQPTEIIVVDDASTDATVTMVERTMSSSTIPVRLLSATTNQGPSIARNLGWDAASGDLIAFLDADDVWHPQKLEIQVPIMESTPHLMMSAHDRTVGEPPEWPVVVARDVEWRDFYFRDFLVRNRCATPSVIVRRIIPERFTGQLRRAEDYFLWLSIAKTYGLVRFGDIPLVHCSNPKYGGAGLSGNLLLMYRSELSAMRLLMEGGHLSKVALPVVATWMTIKFLVRLIDHKILRDRLQTVSESR